MSLARCKQYIYAEQITRFQMGNSESLVRNVNADAQKQQGKKRNENLRCGVLHMSWVWTRNNGSRIPYVCDRSRDNEQPFGRCTVRLFYPGNTVQGCKHILIFYSCDDGSIERRIRDWVEAATHTWFLTSRSKHSIALQMRVYSVSSRQQRYAQKLCQRCV